MENNDKLGMLLSMLNEIGEKNGIKIWANVQLFEKTTAVSILYSREGSQIQTLLRFNQEVSDVNLEESGLMDKVAHELMRYLLFSIDSHGLSGFNDRMIRVYSGRTLFTKNDDAFKKVLTNGK